MKKLTSIVTLLILMLSFSAYAENAVLSSGILTENGVTNKFSVRCDSNKVYWEGGFSVSEKLSEDIYSLIIAIYDGERLAALDSINVDESLSGYSFSEQCIRLSYAPEAVTAKAMALSRDGKLTPLANAVEVSAETSEEPASLMLLSASEIEPYFSFRGAENNLELIMDSGLTYIKGNALVSTSGEAEYQMYVTVKNGDEAVYENVYNIDSRMDAFTIDEKIDIEASEFLYMEVDFAYDNKALITTETKDIVVLSDTATGRILEDNHDGTVDFMIEESDYFDGQEVTVENPQFITLNVENPAFGRNLFVLYDVTIKKANGEYYLESASVSQAQNMATFKSNEVDEFEDGVFLLSDGTEYEVNSEYEVYVNGVLTDILSNPVSTYILSGSASITNLIDKENDGIFDIVCISVASYISVADIEKTDTSITVYFKNYNSVIVGNRSQVTIDTETEKYIITDENGRQMDLTDLTGDVSVNLYADFTSGVANSDFFDFVVSKAVTGRIMGADPGKKGWIYTIGEETYSYMPYVDTGSISKLSVGDTYTLYLDILGDIYGASVQAPDINYGVITRVWNNTSTDVDTIRLINKDGAVADYKCKDSYEYMTVKTNYDEAICNYFDNAYQTMVVTYKLDNSNKIYDISPVRNMYYEAGAIYSESANRVGGFKISDETDILDLTAISKNPVDWDGQITKYGKVADSLMFVDDEEYTVIAGYESQKLSDNSYPFVIVIEGPPPIVPATPVCVVKSVGMRVNPTDNMVYDTVTYLSGSSDELQYAYFYEYPYLSQGDMFVFGTDEYGVVEDYEELFPEITFDRNGISLSTVQNYIYNQMAGLDWRYSVYTQSGIASWDTDRYYNQARVGFGVIAEKGDGCITVGKVNADNKTVIADSDIIDLASDVNVFVYDANAQSTERVYKSSAGVLSPTYLADMFTSDGEILDWDREDCGGNTNPLEAVNTVMFKTLDDEITDILVVLARAE